MQLAERHIIKSTEHRFVEIDKLAFQSKNLYNAANYVPNRWLIIRRGGNKSEKQCVLEKNVCERDRSTYPHLGEHS